MKRKRFSEEQVMLYQLPPTNTVRRLRATWFVRTLVLNPRSETISGRQMQMACKHDRGMD